LETEEVVVKTEQEPEPLARERKTRECRRKKKGSNDQNTQIRPILGCNCGFSTKSWKESGGLSFGLKRKKGVLYQEKKIKGSHQNKEEGRGGGHCYGGGQYGEDRLWAKRDHLDTEQSSGKRGQKHAPQTVLSGGKRHCLTLTEKIARPPEEI